MLLVFSGFLAGLLGSLTGLGGGVVLIPLLTLFVGVPLAYAAGAALVSAVTTSASSAGGYIRRGFVNMRIGVGLTTATTTGAILGTLAAHYVYSTGLEWALYVAFGVVLLASIVPSYERGKSEMPPYKPPDWSTKVFKLWGSYYDPVLGCWCKYWGVRWWLGWALMFAAGFVGGLLGIGAGALKVLALDWAMNLPMRVSTTSSNLMIGVTAATGGSLYWSFGYIQPFIAAVTAVGVFAGSYVGTSLLMRITGRQARWVYTAILAFLGVRMMLAGAAPGISAAVDYAISAAAAVAVTAVLSLRQRGENRREDFEVYRGEPPRPGGLEELFANAVSKLLIYVVFLSTALVVVGVALLAAEGGGMGRPLSVVAAPQSPVNTTSISLSKAAAAALALDGLGVVAVGLVLLLALPFVVVALNFARFVLERDLIYSALGLVTLVNLTVALLASL